MALSPANNSFEQHAAPGSYANTFHQTPPVQSNPNPHVAAKLPITETKRLLDCMNWRAIISSEEHFLVVFFLHNNTCIKTELEENYLTLRCYESTFLSNKKSIEVLRNILINSCESNTPILFFLYLSSQYKAFYFEREDDIHLPSKDKESTDMKEIKESIFKNLSTVLDALHISYKKTQIKKPLPGSNSLGDVAKYTIHWKESPKPYLIPPKPLPDEIPPGKLNSQLFNNRDEHGDFVFKSKTGEVKLHKCVLSIRAPKPLKALLKSGMQELETNTFDLSPFSKETIELFVEYIYLGHHHIADKTIPKHLIFELLAIAHMYQAEEFFNCAANALSTCATEDDLPRLLKLGTLYEKRVLFEISYQLVLNKRARELVHSLSAIKV